MKSRSGVLKLVQAKVRLRLSVLATHSREPIDTLCQLMGHVSIETIASYQHLVVARASNPLDDLLTGPLNPAPPKPK